MIVIATTKEWNIDLFNDTIKEKYNSVLISDPNELKLKTLQKLKPSYIFFPHWSWIIPSEIYENFECVIFHMTDLPFGRGGSPLQNLIALGEKETKISALKATKELDSGDIYLKSDLSLDGTAQEIYKRASKIIYKEMIPKIIQNNPYPKKQEGDAITFARRTPKQSDISKLRTSKEIYDYIRMLDAPSYPHAFIETQNFKIEFKDASCQDDIVSCKAIISLKADNE